MWADGTNVRSDGLFWVCDDFQNDGTHPSRFGSLKVAHALLDFFRDDAVARRWFLAGGNPGPGPAPGPEAISSLVQSLIDDINNQNTTIPDILSRLEDIRDRLLAEGN